MVQINFAQKQVNAKIVYYGPGMSGKTTNLEVIHQRAPEGNRGDLTSISTEGDRTLFFDFMPLDLGTVAGMRTCFQIYTVPGQVYYNSTRKLVLQGVDGVIFVADSSPNMMEENLESLRNLAENLQEYGRDSDEVPIVIQYNKRDIPGALSIEELEQQLNPDGVPAFEAIANTGQGVFPTLKAVAAAVLDSLHRKQSGVEGSEPPAVAPAAPAPIVSAAPVAPAAATYAPAAQAKQEVGRPSVPMSQTGFHKTAPAPLAGAVASTASEPQTTASEPQAGTRELRIATPLSLQKANADALTGATALRQPQPGAGPAPAPAPAPVAQSAPAAVQSPTATVQKPAPPQQQALSPSRPAPMRVEPGTRVPARRMPISQSFPTERTPRATPKEPIKQSAVVTGFIIIASIGLGALLGSYVLSIL